MMDRILCVAEARATVAHDPHFRLMLVDGHAIVEMGAPLPPAIAEFHARDMLVGTDVEWGEAESGTVAA